MNIEIPNHRRYSVQAVIPPVKILGIVINPQALLLSVCRACLYIPEYTQRSEPSLPESLLICVSDLTEVGNPMISRVNNDVTLGLTNDQWSTPMGHHY